MGCPSSANCRGRLCPLTEVCTQGVARRLPADQLTRIDRSASVLFILLVQSKPSLELIHPIGLVDTLPEIPQMSLVFSVNLCPKYMCVSSCCHYLPFEICEFPIVRHMYPCIAIQWTLSERCVVRVWHEIMDWYRIMDWCWK